MKRIQAKCMKYFLTFFGIFFIFTLVIGCIESGNTKITNSTNSSSVITRNENTLFITIDPIPTHMTGDIFKISGTTNLGSDDRVLVGVLPVTVLANKYTKDERLQAAVGDATIIEGMKGINRWEFNVDTNAWPPQNYLVQVSSLEGINSTSFFDLKSP